ncbi:hypothetical protein O9929_04355 [Vibrio lentus]|nr:hypothetical protein [Vibrio lentus]
MKKANSTARRNQGETITHTYRGNNADQFAMRQTRSGRNSSNSKAAATLRTGNRTLVQSVQIQIETARIRSRTDRENNDRRSGKASKP